MDEFESDSSMAMDSYVEGTGGGGGGAYINSVSEYDIQGSDSTTSGLAMNETLDGHNVTIYQDNTVGQGADVMTSSWYDSNGNVIASTFVIVTDSGGDIYSSVNGEPAQLIGHIEPGSIH